MGVQSVHVFVEKYAFDFLKKNRFKCQICGYKINLHLHSLCALNSQPAQCEHDNYEYTSVQEKP